MPKTAGTPRKIFWFFLPGLLWIALFCLRPVFFTPWCAVRPTPCTVDSVNAFDQYGFYFHSITADFWSNILQNGMGVVLALVPVLLLRDRKRLWPIEKFFIWGTLWNGVGIEFSRTLAQRPRPMVMNSPFESGAQIAQYTSFYSGHTSFVAFATLTLALWLHAELGMKDWKTRLAILGYLFLVPLTAFLRVYGGRHYPTDVICGAWAGSIVALFLWKVYGRKLLTPPSDVNSVG
jgi:membrane-associated phospholipid phosphatase